MGQPRKPSQRQQPLHKEEECPDSIEGDIDGDGEVTILDIVLIVNCILSNDCDDCSDLNYDGSVDVLDIMIMVNLVLEN